MCGRHVNTQVPISRPTPSPPHMVTSLTQLGPAHLPQKKKRRWKGHLKEGGGIRKGKERSPATHCQPHPLSPLHRAYSRPRNNPNQRGPVTPRHNHRTRTPAAHAPHQLGTSRLHCRPRTPRAPRAPHSATHLRANMSPCTLAASALHHQGARGVK